MKDETRILEKIESHVEVLPRIERLFEQFLERASKLTVARVERRRPDARMRPEVVRQERAKRSSPARPVTEARGARPEKPSVPVQSSSAPLSKKSPKKQVNPSGFSRPTEKLSPKLSAPAPNPPQRKSEHRQQEIRQKRQDAKRDSLLARVLSGAMEKARKGFDLASDVLGLRTDAGDAMGLAAGGPIWSAIRELTEAVDVTRDNRYAKAVLRFLTRKPDGDDKGIRDEKGRFLKKPKSRRDETAEAVADVKETILKVDKKETKRHKALLKEVDDIPSGAGAGGGGLLSGALGMLKGGGLGALAGGIGGKVLAKIPGRGLLAKVAGTKVGGALAKGAKAIAVDGAGGVLSKGAGKVLSGAGGMFGKLGGGLAKGAGKSAIKKIPILGALAGGGFAASRLINGDVGGALGELASGLASIVPGIGTVASAAIDAGLVARDMAREHGEKLGDAMAESAEKTMDAAEEQAAKALEDRDEAIQDMARRTKFVWYRPSTWASGRPEPAPKKDGAKVKKDTSPPAVVSGEGLGRVSEKYESGGRGVGTVSTGVGDAGGVSYGRHQLASKTGTMQAFLNSDHGAAFRDRFKGMAPGSEAFNQAYKDVATSNEKSFSDAQHAFIKETHFDPVANYAKAKGIDVDNEAIQEALWSQSVQHGGKGNRKIIDEAVAKVGQGAGAQDTINALYDARSNYASQFASAAATTGRYARERQDVLAIAEKPQQIAGAGKEIKKTLQQVPQQGRMATEQVGQAIAAVTPNRLPQIKEMIPPAPTPPIVDKAVLAANAPKAPDLPSWGHQRGGRKQGDSGLPVPTEFSDTLLALMSIDRI